MFSSCLRGSRRWLGTEAGGKHGGIAVLRDVRAVREFVAAEKREGRSVGFVPTMGGIHTGHMDCVRHGLSAGLDTVLGSIFVNPTQFSETEDFGAYPRQEAADLELFAEAGARAVFVPSVDAMYPKVPFKTRVNPVGAELTHEGASRPHFFAGVATVVTKLLNAVQPDVLVLGQKDAMQVIVVSNIIRDLLMDTRVSVCPTTRETDGLALSSRNTYLSAEERAVAPALYKALSHASKTATPDTDLRPYYAGKETSAGSLATEVANAITAASPLFGRIDYVSFFDAYTGQELTSQTQSTARNGAVVCALAVRLGTTRLIDNLVLFGGNDDLGVPA